MIKVGDKYPSRDGEREYLVVYVVDKEDMVYPVLAVDINTKHEEWFTLDGKYNIDDQLHRLDMLIHPEQSIAVGHKYKNKHLVNKTIEVLAVFDNMSDPDDKHVVCRINQYGVSIYQENYIKEYYELVE